MNKKILIIEDDEDLSLAMSIRLRAAGYSVTTAISGASALLLASNEQPDLVLLDLGLPGHDGIAVMAVLNLMESTSKVPVIIVTGRDPATAMEGNVLPYAGFFSKPVDTPALLDAIKKILFPEKAD
jgi:DNA-binding response OmpR family regulator